MLLDFCSIQGIPEVQANMIYVVFSHCSVSDQDKVNSKIKVLSLLTHTLAFPNLGRSSVQCYFSIVYKYTIE